MESKELPNVSDDMDVSGSFVIDFKAATEDIVENQTTNILNDGGNSIQENTNSVKETINSAQESVVKYSDHTLKPMFNQNQNFTTPNFSQMIHKKSLLHGKFHAPKKTWGPSCPYVIVPTGWGPENDEEYVNSIFSALDIPMPPILFITNKSHQLFPGIGIRRKRGDDVRGKSGSKDSDDDDDDEFEIILDNPTDEEIGLFKVVMESKLVTIMEAISNTFAQCKAIYLCRRNFIGNVFDEVIGSSLPENGVQLAVHPISNVESGTFGIMENAVPLTDDIERATIWKEPQFETDANSDVGKYAVNGTLTLKVTHALLFEDEDDMGYFNSAVERVISVGLFCIGGTAPLTDSALSAIRKGSPLFVFKHTIRAGHAISSLIEYYDEVIKNKNRKAASIEERLFPGGKNIFSIWDNIKTHVQKVAYNWPEQYNEEAVLVIDALRDKPQELLLGIVNLMASVQGNFIETELGGSAAEQSVMAQSRQMRLHLEKLERKYQRIATILYTVVVLLGCAITVIAVVSSDTYIHTDRYTEQDVKYMNAVNTALPIILGIIMTIYSTIAPESNWASFAYARARIESETYKYRCRVGPYRRRVGVNGTMSSRSIFTDSLKEIWSEIDNLDLVEFGSSDASHYQFLKQNRIYPDTESIPSAGDHAIGVKGRSDSKTVTKDIINKKIQKIQQDSRKTRFVLTAEEYIEERILPELLKMERESPGRTFSFRCLQILIIILSSVGAIFSANNAQVWIPVLFAIATIPQAILKFYELPLKIQRANASFAFMKKLLLWWTGLSLMEQRVHENKTKLVLDVEDMLLADISAITRAQESHSRSKSNVEDSTGDATSGASIGNSKHPTHGTNTTDSRKVNGKNQ